MKEQNVLLTGKMRYDEEKTSLPDAYTELEQKLTMLLGVPVEFVRPEEVRSWNCENKED